MGVVILGMYSDIRHHFFYVKIQELCCKGEVCHNIVRLSFAISTRVIKEKARVVAMDLRGHGKSSTENEIDMSIEVHILNHSISENSISFFFWL